MQRRQLISSLSAGVIGAAMFPASPAANAAATVMTPAEYATFDEWLQAARAAALQLVEETGAKDTEQFMQFLALWAMAMPDPDQYTWQQIPGANLKFEAASLARGRPFVVGGLKLAPGYVVPPHCHPMGGAVSLCVEGSLVIRHYDLVPGAAAYTETGAVVEVEETATAYLQKGQFTQFTPTRGNLHRLQAGPEGATVVEMSVQWGGTGAFSYLKFEDQLRAVSDTTTRRQRGTWVGMDIALA
jgi:hypothetical protein